MDSQSHGDTSRVRISERILSDLSSSPRLARICYMLVITEAPTGLIAPYEKDSLFAEPLLNPYETQLNSDYMRIENPAGRRRRPF